MRRETLSWMRTRQRRNKTNGFIANALGRLYKDLFEVCCRGPVSGCGCYGNEDIFQETILFVIRDLAASTLRTDDEIIRHFKYRFQMIRYQVMKDNQQLKEVNYADNIQAQNGSSETEE